MILNFLISIMTFLDKGKSSDELREMFDWGEQTATLEEEVQSYFLFCICICIHICNSIRIGSNPKQGDYVFFCGIHL